MLRNNVISGPEPARWAPGKGASGLFLGLALVLAWPAAGQVDAEEDDSAAAQASDREAPAKEVRPALARRKRNALSQFDPKVFEARGRELQDQYYEITSLAKGGTAWSAAPADAEGEAGPASSPREISSSKKGSKNWMIWSGAAGLAALVGGAAGYLLLEQHTAPDPVSVHLDDNPGNP